MVCVVLLVVKFKRLYLLAFSSDFKIRDPGFGISLNSVFTNLALTAKCANRLLSTLQTAPIFFDIWGEPEIKLVISDDKDLSPSKH